MAKLNSKRGRMLLILLTIWNEKEINRFIIKWKSSNELKNDKKLTKDVKKNSVSV